MIPFRPIAFTELEAADWFLLGPVVALVLAGIVWVLASWLRK